MYIVSRRKHGYTLAEMLMAMFAGSVLMAGSYKGFSILSRQYDAVRSSADVQDGGKAVLDLLAADMRKAGRLAFDGAGQAPSGAIAAPLTVAVHPDTACCDILTIVYDRSTAERVEIRYYVQQRDFPETRYALYRDSVILDGNTRTAEYTGSFVADYIDAFHVAVLETNNAGQPLVADVELTMRAKNQGFYTGMFSTPAYASMPVYTAPEDAFFRKFFSKTVLLRNLEKF